MAIRLFIYEYVCGGGAGPDAAPLRTEGWAMLAALLEDFARLPGITVETMLGRDLHKDKETRRQGDKETGRQGDRETGRQGDRETGKQGDKENPSVSLSPCLLVSLSPCLLVSLSPGLPAGVVAHETGFGGEEALFRRLAAAADWSLVVAPECADLLPERLRWLEEAGGRSLGSTPAAARLAGDKLRLAECLRGRGVPTPPTAAWPTAPSFPAVCKPRYGAGSQDTFLVRDEVELRRAGASAADPAGAQIVQPFVPGDPASVAFLIGPGRRLALPPVAQHLSADGRFHYQGGRLPLAPALAERATRLAARAVEAVNGLHGYVGVDLVLGATAADDAVMEINPRMTTSYVGLRALARFNLAGALLAVAAGRAPPTWEWGTELVHFTADGRLLDR